MKITIRQENAWTIIDLLLGALAVAFIFVLSAMASQVVLVNEHSLGLALVAAALGGLFGVLLIILFLRLCWSFGRRRQAKLREKYHTIYRVKELPTNARSIIKPERAEIQIGDYGWDARPSRKDGLIHLQGLTKKWQVVWHASFRSDQIEKVAEKPNSQYEYWHPDWAKPPPAPPCPYPVRDRNTPTMGLPSSSAYYFKDYPSQYYLAESKQQFV
jgi:hypothetical protein